MEVYLHAMRSMVLNYKKQDGTKIRPARSCRDLKIDHPEKKNGEFFFHYFNFTSMVKLDWRIILITLYRILLCWS
jgi:hypothetical protein